MQYFSEFSGLETESALLKQNRIGILGGTFNPVHNGHLAIAKIALYEFLLEKVVFLPLGTPPHKKDEYIAPPEHRLEMVKLAIQGEPRFSVSTLEIFREGILILSIRWRYSRVKAKNAEYYYIIAQILFFELKTWKNYERVFCLANFICVLRPARTISA
jgi:nicotinate-nucleotide adenylyltransferase